MTEPCSQVDLLREMHGDIKALLTEFKNMNGTLVKTQKEFGDHEVESKIYRYRITIIWFVMQGIKWAVGGGILTTLLLFLFKK